MEITLMSKHHKGTGSKLGTVNLKKYITHPLKTNTSQVGMVLTKSLKGEKNKFSMMKVKCRTEIK